MRVQNNKFSLGEVEMRYFFIAYVCCIANFYLAIEHKALLYIVFAFIFLVVSILSYFCAKYNTYHFTLIVFYAVMIWYLIVQNNIYGEYIADYLLLSVQLSIITLLSIIELIKDLSPLKRKVFSYKYRFS